MALDPVEAALSGSIPAPPMPPSSDPIEAALSRRGPAQVLEKPPEEGTALGQFFKDVGSNAANAAQAFAHHAMNLPHGGAQLVEHIGAGLAQRIAPDSRFANAISDVAMKDDEGLAKRERDYQASVPNSAGAYAGAAAGEIAPFLLGGELQKGISALGDVGTRAGEYVGSKIPQVARLAPYAGRILGGALQGGAIGATAPVTSAGEPYSAQKGSQMLTGALIGGAAPLVSDAVRGTYNAAAGLVKPIVAPQSVVKEALQKWAGPDAEEIASRLSNPREYVPGSKPTTAQLAGSPALVQVEKTLANDPAFKPAMMQREIENNAARMSVINDVSGAPGALEAAQAERGKVAQNLYGWAFDHTPDVTPWMKGQVTQLTKRPAIQQAMKEARVLAQNEGIKFTDATSIQGLHYTKTALDDQISTAMRQGNNNQARILIDTRDKLLTLMDKMSPTYAQARSEFAKMSAPINTMEAGRAISDKIGSGALNASGQPVATLPAYRSALSSALKGADYGIEPAAQARLEGVQSDLQRATVSNSIKSPGSDTAFNVQAPSWLGRHLYGENFSGPTGTGKIIGGLLGGTLTGHPILGAAAGYGAAEKIGQYAGSKVNAALADALLHPEVAARLLQSGELPPSQAAALVKALAARLPQAAAYSGARQAVQVP